MGARVPPPGTWLVVPELALRLGAGVGSTAFVLVGAVAVTAGVGVETAAVRALVAAVVLGGLAAATGYVLGPGESPASPPPRQRGGLVDVTLPEERGG